VAQGKGISKSVTDRIPGKSLSTRLAHFFGEQMRGRATLHFSFTVALGVHILGGGAARFTATGKRGERKTNRKDKQNNEGGAGFHEFVFLRTQIRNN